jgi:hypothetical protein
MLFAVLKTFILRTIGCLIGVFLTIEVYFQCVVRTTNVVPSFLRVYDFRYFDTSGTPRFTPNLTAWHRSYGERVDTKIQINSHGFRGDEPLSKPSFRISMIGDSTVFNGGVNLEESFPYLLQASLRRNRQDPQIEVLNFGVGDTNARQHYLKFKHHMLEYRPNLAMVFLYLNDSADSQSSVYRAAARLPVIPWYHSFAAEELSRGLRSLSLLFQSQTTGRFDWVRTFQARDYLRDEASWREMQEAARYDWGAAWDEAAWRSIEPSVQGIVEAAKVARVRVVFVVLPVSPQIELPETINGLFRPQELARQMANRLNLELLDPLPDLRSLKNKEGIYYDQCHFTVGGNLEFARYLESILDKQSFPADGRPRWVGRELERTLAP